MPERREAVLDALRSSEAPMSILDLAHQLGLHANTVRFHLQVLADSGRVERVEPTRSSPGRPPLMFRAHRGMDPAGPRNYQLLADALATRLSADNESTDKAVEAGRAWGHRLAAGTRSTTAVTTDDQATDQLVEMLGELGFSPQRRSSGRRAQIALRHCPFLDLVPEHENVICPVHLGLMQGAMAAMSAAVTIERLEPFAEPDLCLAHVGSAEATA
ncbi:MULTISPECIES: helix-turn-helix domain-containing protein [unclassified Nocardioides]|uniref:helix-turn-helix transcriptional regulator n=1 Tax=unclassified Nocardioides TaxID=2615069 RepID=UPI000057058B|nr:MULTISPECIES: helix-turn-helix domain-containing protein [unclassified Nocardioides]ABL79442.1 transcriptional regulator [Nocardioides sp. JS614]